MANFFRFYLHVAALDLLIRLRRTIILPPPPTEELGLPAELPTAAIDEPHRKKFFNRRRKGDPLGEGFACTRRTGLIKVAAEVITHTRRVIIRLSSTWPHLGYFLTVSTLPLAIPSGSFDQCQQRRTGRNQRRSHHE